MRILYVHSYYQIRGGEEFVFEQESLLLKETQEVEILSYYNKSGIKGALQFFFSIWNVYAAFVLKKVITTYKPDVIHFHNTHYATGPLVLRVAAKFNIPIVITFHNYRLLCPSGTFLNKDKVFIDSLQQDFPWNAVFKKVFRNSLIQTFWSAFVFWFHKKIGTWRKIDAAIVMTSFAKDLYNSSNIKLSPSKFYVKPNFVSKHNSNTVVPGEEFLYVGRLSIEKGIDVLLEAFCKSGYKLRIAGTGQLREKVENVAREYKNITYLGSLQKSEIFLEMQKCSALIFPSIWYETFGLVLIEAFSLKCAVIASEIGSASQIIQNNYNGLHFTPNDRDSLIKQLDYWNELPDSVKEVYRQNAFIDYNTYYTPESNKENLMSIYKEVIYRK